MSTVRHVERQYDAFPYPQPEQVAQQLPAQFSRGVLNFLLRRREPDWLPADARVWVAGCGTQQGAMWALSNPTMEIVATDLSDKVLGIAGELASQLGITNVRFEKQDITQSSFRDEFDLVVSTGVIHHLPEPAVGMAKVREALRPGGAAAIMVYSKMHREPLQAFRRAHGLLARNEEDPDARYALACRLLGHLLESERCSPPCPDALQLLWDSRERNRPFVADALLHPLEHTYDVDGFFELLGAAGLAHRSWLYPAQWDVDTYVDDAELVESLEQLEPLDQYRAVYNIAGYNGPQLDALAEPTEAPEQEPLSLDEVLRMRVLCSQGLCLHRVEGGRVTAIGKRAPFVIEDDRITGRARGGFGVVETWSVPAEAAPIFELADGSRTIGELLDALSAQFDRQQLLQLIGRLLPADIGVLAPC